MELDNTLSICVPVLLMVHGCHHFNLHQRLIGQYFYHVFGFRKQVLISVPAQIFFVVKFTTVNPRHNDSIVPKDVAIKINLLLYRILNEQIDM